jgi:hypothetical protein
MKTKKLRYRLPTSNKYVDVVVFRRMCFFDSVAYNFGEQDPHEVYNYTRKEIVRFWKVNGHNLMVGFNYA